MRLSVPIPQGVEALYGTRDENIRLLEVGLGVRTRLASGSLEIEGDDAGVERACRIVSDYTEMVREGQNFSSGDMANFLRIVTGDDQVTLRALVCERPAAQFWQKSSNPEDHQSAPLSGSDRTQ